jgi:hypothetical protein
MRSIRALLFSDRQQLAVERSENNKARSHAQRGKAFSLLSTSQRIKPNAERRNPPCFYPQTPQGGLKEQIIMSVQLIMRQLLQGSFFGLHP